MSQNGKNAPGYPRRFLPQPIETTARNHKGYLATSNSKEPKGLSEDGPQARSERSLLAPPQPPGYNTGTFTHADANEYNKPNRSSLDQQHQSGREPRPKRHLPQPIETTNRSKRPVDSRPIHSEGAKSTTTQAVTRKFTPQLIETGKRSFRRQGRSHDPGSNNEFNPVQVTVDHAAQLPTESRFSYASLLRRHETRRHSFRVPDLPAIPSSGSEASDGSEMPSLFTSPSASPGASSKSKIVDGRRESCDEEYSGYLLSLAARTAEKQLKDQALAAFPNEQVYQPVDHFAIDREDEGSPNEEELTDFPNIEGSSKYRRASSADLSWELEHMRQHKEEAVMRSRAMIEPQESHFSSTAIAGRLRPHVASPPMLGEDLIFPQSLSPEATLCETDSGRLHRQGIQANLYKDPGCLWSANFRIDDKSGSAGLWMGTCQKANGFDHRSQDNLYPDIVTPIHELEQEPCMCLHEEAITEDSDRPASATSDRNSPFDSLEEARINEFHDGFVTQIYNYLSLGYPCLARYYDHELSKISGIPVEELRRDDLKTDARGYVVHVENDAEGNQCTCARWMALRLYIHEWAKQQPNLLESNGNCDAWGVRERRGSWAG